MDITRSSHGRRLLTRLPVMLGIVAGYLALAAFLIFSPENQSYGMALFLFGPFLLGYAIGLLYPVPAHAPLPKRALVLQAATVTTLLMTCGFLLALGIEGVLCLAMAAPLVWVFAIIGAAISTIVPRNRFGHASLFLLTCALLFLSGVERAILPAPLTHPVVTAITIDAPADVVWNHVIEFEDMAPATEWYFRAGIASPLRARIEGVGVGAIRYCEFTTGAFVEPITVWEENRRLAFDVVENPPPMQELSPWPHLHTGHLEGFLVSKQGEFLLTELPGGRTELRGTTHYQHGLFPESYWRWWADAILHRVHLRVLNHIKHGAEAEASESAA